MQCLGLDIGSSSIKGAVLDLKSGQVHSIVKEPFPEPIPGLPAGWFEIDPLEVVERSRRVISQLLALAPEAKSVFLCGQMGGVVVVDENHRPVTNYLSWRDQRTLGPHFSGGNYLDAMRRDLVESLLGPQEDNEQLLWPLGNELKPGSTTSLLYWLCVNKVQLAGHFPATNFLFVEYATF